MRKRKKKALQARRILVHPGTELKAEDGGDSRWWQLAKPQDLTATHGVNITLGYLQAMVDDYDPVGVERASVNRDHQKGGPSLGWIQELRIQGGALWGRVVNLNEGLRRDILEGSYIRGSIEWLTSHAATGRQYLKGFAALGNDSPAIKGLQPLTAAEPSHQSTGGEIMKFDLERISASAAEGGALIQGSPGASPPGAVLTLTDASGATLSATASADGVFQAKGKLAGKVTLTAADPAIQAVTVEVPAAAASQPPPPDKPALVVAADPGLLLAMEQRLRAVEAQNHLLHAAEAADAVLTGVLDRVTPGMRNAGARDLLIKAHAQPALFQALSALLAAVPRHGLTSEELAAANGCELKAAGDQDMLAAAEDHGIDAAELSRLRKSYPGSFGAQGGPN